MKSSGLWIGQPAPDTTSAKRFKNELDEFVQSQQFLVKEDKIAVAQQKVNETKAIANKNVKELAKTNNSIDEELLPSALDLAVAGKEEENIANEIHHEEVTRRR